MCDFLNLMNIEQRADTSDGIGRLPQLADYGANSPRDCEDEAAMHPHLPRSALTKNSVSVVDGQTSATRTPWPITSSCRDSENPIIANFVAHIHPCARIP